MRNTSPQERTILFVIPGDIQRQTGGSLYNRKLAESLTQRGFGVDVATVPDLPYFAGLAAGLIISARLLLRLARRKYDVVIADGWAHPTTLLFNVACWLTGNVRLVIIVHQVRCRAVNKSVAFIVRMAERLSLRSGQLIVTVSGFISREVELLIGSEAPILLAPPGSAALSGSKRERSETGAIPIRLLFVGNCTRLKGLDHLIGALAFLRDIPLGLDIVGDVNVEPRYYRELVKQASALGVSERVMFHGPVAHEDLGHFYSRADIFTFPSLYEGFGIVLAEAMHSGLAIVASRTGATDEIVREGTNALIVPPADSAALAGAIRRLATNTQLREDFRRGSRELAGSLPTWAQTCDSICERIEAMSRTTRGTTRTTKSIPTP